MVKANTTSTPRRATNASWIAVLGDRLADLYGSAELLEDLLDHEKAADPIGHAVRHLMNDLANLQKTYTAARSEILDPTKAGNGGAA
jgi:hypothetical protein